MTWILAGATVLVLSVIAVGLRRADRDRCRAAHPTALVLAYPLLVAANGDMAPPAAAALPRLQARHLVVVRSGEGELTGRS